MQYLLMDGLLGTTEATVCLCARRCARPENGAANSPYGSFPISRICSASGAVLATVRCGNSLRNALNPGRLDPASVRPAHLAGGGRAGVRGGVPRARGVWPRRRVSTRWVSSKASDDDGISGRRNGAFERRREFHRGGRHPRQPCCRGDYCRADATSPRTRECGDVLSLALRDDQSSAGNRLSGVLRRLQHRRLGQRSARPHASMDLARDALSHRRRYLLARRSLGDDSAWPTPNAWRRGARSRSESLHAPRICRGWVTGALGWALRARRRADRCDLRTGCVAGRHIRARLGTTAVARSATR